MKNNDHNHKLTHIPELPAYLDTSPQAVNLWRAWCSHCKKWHAHGAGHKNEDPMQFLGHRVAHCSDQNSPYYYTGYELVYGGLWNELPKQVRKRGWQQCRG